VLQNLFRRKLTSDRDRRMFVDRRNDVNRRAVLREYSWWPFAIRPGRPARIKKRQRRLVSKAPDELKTGLTLLRLLATRC